MNEIHLAYGALQAEGPLRLPLELEGVDYLLLDAGPPRAASELGPEGLLEQALEQLGPRLYLDTNLHVLATLAGRQPRASVLEIARQLSGTGNADLRIAEVQGCDVLDRLEEFLAGGAELRNLATGERVARSTKPIESVTACLDPQPLVAALRQDARVVVTGYASPGTAVVGMATAEFGSAIQHDQRLEKFVHAGKLLAASAGRSSSPDASDGPPDVLKLTAEGGYQWVTGEGGERLGDSTLAKPQALAQHPSQTPAAGQTLLNIVYREGSVGSVLLEASGTNASEDLSRAIAAWQEGVASGGAAAGAVVRAEVYASVTTPPAAVGVVTFQHEAAPEVQTAIDALQRQCARWTAGPQLRPDFPPQVAARFGAWQTSVPREFIEWSVDVRTARDWLT